MSDSEARQRWWDEHGDFPYLALGWVDDRGRFFCLDHPRAKRKKTAVFASDLEAEQSRCAICGQSPRAAKAFGSVDEADFRVRAGGRLAREDA